MVFQLIGGIFNEVVQSDADRDSRKAIRDTQDQLMRMSSLDIFMLQEQADAQRLISQREFSRANADAMATAAAHGVSVGSASVQKAIELNTMQEAWEAAVIDRNRIAQTQRITEQTKLSNMSADAQVRQINNAATARQVGLTFEFVSAAAGGYTGLGGMSNAGAAAGTGLGPQQEYYKGM